jgi:hypothetical protein
MGEQTMSYGTVQAEKMTTESGYSLGAGNASSFKNRIINGGMVIDQRNNGAAVTSNNNTIYSVDRFVYFTNGSATGTLQQSSVAPTGFTNSLLYTIGSGSASGSTTRAQLIQRIEGSNVADLAWGSASAKSITLSFWVRSSLTGTFGGVLQNSAQDRSYPFTYTINAANTWEYETITIPGDTSGTWLTGNGSGVQVYWDMGCGSSLTTTAGAWASGDFRGATGTTSVVAVTGATWQMTGVQFEVGTVATSFDFRSIGTELALCQRYYQVLASGQNACLSSGFYFTSGILIGYAAFPTTMRTSPVIAVVTGTNFYNFANTGGNDQLNSFTIDIGSPNSVSLFNNTDVSGTAGYGGIIRCNNASASVAMSAEL